MSTTVIRQIAAGSGRFPYSGGTAMTHRPLAVAAVRIAAAAIRDRRCQALGGRTHELTVFDPYDQAAEPDVPLDPDTHSEAERLVDDYTSRIEDTVAAEDEPIVDEYEDIQTPQGQTSDELIDEAAGRSRTTSASAGPWQSAMTDAVACSRGNHQQSHDHQITGSPGA